MSKIERQSRLRPPHSYRDWSRLLCAPQEGVNHRDMARIDEAFGLAGEAMAAACARADAGWGCGVGCWGAHLNLARKNGATDEQISAALRTDEPHTSAT